MNTKATSLHFASDGVQLDKRKHARIYSDAELVALCDPDSAHYTLDNYARDHFESVAQDGDIS